MTKLSTRIKQAIDNQIGISSNSMREQYEDNYDGFTHSSYSGLAEDIEDEIIAAGYDESVSTRIIEGFVFDMF